MRREIGSEAGQVSQSESQLEWEWEQELMLETLRGETEPYVEKRCCEWLDANRSRMEPTPEKRKRRRKERKKGKKRKFKKD